MNAPAADTEFQDLLEENRPWVTNLVLLVLTAHPVPQVVTLIPPQH